jgi:transposase InsO family protein
MVAFAEHIIGLVALLLRTQRDAFRSRGALLAENALLRHQLAIMERSIARPNLMPLDRLVLVALSIVVPTWKNVLRLVQPATLLRWHRRGFRALWRWKTRTGRTAPARRLDPETVTLIRTMAKDNRLWGAKRIRGELLKLGIAVSKRTVQKYMKAPRARGPCGQRWSTFLKNHAHEFWACDFLQCYDVFFRPIFAFAFIELATRKIVHIATTRFPCWGWVTQQLRNATPFGLAPRFLLRDRDGKYGPAFDALARATGIRVIKTAIRAPNMNAVCERFLGSLRRECLDHVIVVNDRHFDRVVREYAGFYNGARPHQALRQQTPVPADRPSGGKIVKFPVLGGLHHDYRRAA